MEKQNSIHNVKHEEQREFLSNIKGTISLPTGLSRKKMFTLAKKLAQQKKKEQKLGILVQN